MKRAIIHMVETDRQWLMKLLTEHIDISKFTHEQVQSYANILRDVGIAAVPAPLGVVENIGSCEPDPVIVRWDKTGATWHTDVDKVGRYSVRRQDSRKEFGAYLNGRAIDGIESSMYVDQVKRDVETRIKEARRINAMHE